MSHNPEQDIVHLISAFYELCDFEFVSVVWISLEGVGVYFKIQSVAQICPRVPRLLVRATTKCRFSERNTQVELKDNLECEYWYTSLTFILPF